MPLTTPVVYNWGQFCPLLPGDIWQWKELLLASSGYRSGMLKNILQCTRQPPTAKNYPAPNVNLRNPDLPKHFQYQLMDYPESNFVHHVDFKVKPIQIKAPGELEFIDSGKYCEVAIFIV